MIRQVDIDGRWHDVPDEAKYIAQDVDGEWSWYSAEPREVDGYWEYAEGAVGYITYSVSPTDYTQELYELGDRIEEESAPKPLVFKIVEEGTVEKEGEVRFSLQKRNNNRIFLTANGWILLDITPKGVKRIRSVSHTIGIAVDSISRIVLDED